MPKKDDDDVAFESSIDELEYADDEDVLAAFLEKLNDLVDEGNFRGLFIVCQRIKGESSVFSLGPLNFEQIRDTVKEICDFATTEVPRNLH